ncbi:MAG: hypothetical protein VXY53_07840, partial [Candidatus Thermoplasmatota archaeon]|nr:hypothetical protein [Candidatus Thermoplasmatota archaeon]
FDDFFEIFEEDEFMKEGERQALGSDFESEKVMEESSGENTEQIIYLDLPSNGQFDITLTALEAISDVTIVASWAYTDMIDPIVEPATPNEPVVEETCRDMAEIAMKENDKNGDGVLNAAELKAIFVNQQTLNFAQTDLNADGEIEYSELLQITCSCSNELELTFNQLSPFDREVSIERLTSQIYENEYNFFDIDSNSNLQISRSEIDILVLLCETTFDAFDGDGDGVPDVSDAFPNDPDETKDTDGDGVGDNADLAPSVANDIIYSAGAILAIGLLAMLVLVLRNSRTKEQDVVWESEKQYNLAEQMLNMQENSATAPMQDVEMRDLNTQDLGKQYENKDNFADSENLFEQLISQTNSPPEQLLGMIDTNGVESIEY